jgi:hypothetical protein
VLHQRQLRGPGHQAPLALARTGPACRVGPQPVPLLVGHRRRPASQDLDPGGALASTSRSAVVAGQHQPVSGHRPPPPGRGMVSAWCSRRGWRGQPAGGRRGAGGWPGGGGRARRPPGSLTGREPDSPAMSHQVASLPRRRVNRRRGWARISTPTWPKRQGGCWRTVAAAAQPTRWGRPRSLFRPGDVLRVSCPPVAGRRRASRSPAQAPDGSRRSRPQRRAVERAQDGVGWVRLLRCRQHPAAAGLRAGALARRAVHAGQRRARLPVVQRQQCNAEVPAGCGAGDSTNGPSCCATWRSTLRSRCSSKGQTPSEAEEVGFEPGTRSSCRLRSER